MQPDRTIPRSAAAGVLGRPGSVRSEGWSKVGEVGVNGIDSLLRTRWLCVTVLECA